MVSYGGKIGPGPWNNECPHVVEVEPGLFYFFRNQYYGQRARNWVYRSDNPLNFGIDDDRKLVRSWRVAAPEIIHHEGQYYIASLMDSLKGIKIARLKWLKLPELGEAVFDFNSAAVRDCWTLKSGNLAAVFTNSTRHDFEARTEYFIGTAEVGQGKFDDAANRRHRIARVHAGQRGLHSVRLRRQRSAERVRGSGRSRNRQRTCTSDRRRHQRLDEDSRSTVPNRKAGKPSSGLSTRRRRLGGTSTSAGSTRIL